MFTSLFDPLGTFPEFSKLSPVCMPMNRMGVLRSNHRIASPLLARTFSNFVVDARVTVCSSSGWAHGVNATGRKIVYCYAPARWLYQTEKYFEPSHPYSSSSSLSSRIASMRGTAGHAGFRLFRPSLRRWDQRAAASADRYITSSAWMAKAIKIAYSIDAEVLHPPPAISSQGTQCPVAGIEHDFVLCVSRLMPYKNVNALVRAIDKCPNLELVVVGDGPELPRLKSIASRCTHLVGQVDDDELRWLYANTKGLVSASFEDFGLTPLEAASFGKPAAVLRAGGFLETVIEGKSGLFFNTPNPDEIARTIRQLRSQDWDEEFITSHAATFSESEFTNRFKEIVAEEARNGKW
jgi:glycosyltransferase involved in cell wall biosynthesis